MSTEIPKIYPALAAIMRQIEAIPKDDKNQSQGFKFRSIDSTLGYLHPIFAEHGVVCLPVEVDTVFDEKTNKNGTLMRHAVTKVTYRFLADDGSFVDTKTIGESLDSADKCVSKSLSIALKGLMFAAFLIPVDMPDPDYDSHELSPQDQKRALDAENERIMKLERERMEAQGLDADMAEAFDAPKKQPAKKEPDWENYVIQCIAGDRWNGKKLSELDNKGITTLMHNWVMKNKILENATNPEMDSKKLHEAVMIEAAFRSFSSQD